MVSKTTCLGVLYLYLFYPAILVEGIGSLFPVTVTDHMTPPTISPFGNITLTNLPPMTSAPSPVNHSLQSAISNVSLPATLAPMPTAAHSNVTFGPMQTIIPDVHQTAPVLFPGNNSMGNSTATPIVLGDITMPHAGNITLPATGMSTGAPAHGVTTPAGGGAPGVTAAAAGGTTGHGSPILPLIPAILPLGNGTNAPMTGTLAPGITTTKAAEQGAREVTTAAAGGTTGHGSPAATLLPLLPALLPLGNTTSVPGMTAGHGAPATSVTLPGLTSAAAPAGNGTAAPGMTTAHGGVASGGTMAPIGNMTIVPGMTTAAGAPGMTTAHGAMQPGIPTLGNMTLMPAMTTATGAPGMSTAHGAPAVSLLPGLPTLAGITSPFGVTMMAGMTTTKPGGAPSAANGTMSPMNGTMPPGITTVHGAPAVTLLPGLPTLAAGNMTIIPGMTTMAGGTMPPGMTTARGAPAITLMPGMTATKPAGTASNGTMPTMNGTMPPGMTTTKTSGASTGNMTTTEKPLLSPCGATACFSDEVCVQPPFNASQTCTRRRSDRRYCADNPCPTGMKCFDNVTSQAYTCYTKLDGAAGECLGIQCSPGDICYQVMGQQAKCIQMHQAPRCLGQNEEFSACKSGCESTCSIPSPPCMNSTTCTSGCACIRGYVRLNGVCELMSKCPSTTTGSVTCSGTEQFMACKPACEKSCSGVPSKACQLSLNSTTTIAPAVCTPGCTCRNAYKRDTDSGQCIHARQCFQSTTCGLNESWSRCHNCEAMCGQATNPSCKACWSGCGCNPGFSRSTAGVCVESAKCS